MRKDIPKFTRSDILKGIELIDNLDPKLLKKSTRYELLFNQKRYPPKEVIRYAGIAIRGYPPNHFSGGDETNNVLIKLGFTIVLIGTNIAIGYNYTEKKRLGIIDERDLSDWESSFSHDIEQDTNIGPTDKEILTKGRIGHSRFKQKLMMHYSGCAICGMTYAPMLIASHIKPWKDSTDEERLDANNGLLLCPNHDALFDKGYITFRDDGSILISEHLDQATKNLLNIQEGMKVKLTSGQKVYMAWHRMYCFDK